MFANVSTKNDLEWTNIVALGGERKIATNKWKTKSLAVAQELA
jgi:hypothetical protein